MINQLQWSNTKKIVFYFCFIFFLLYIFPFPIDLLSSLEIGWLNKILSAPEDKFWHNLVPWVGDNIFKLKNHITIFTNGSGDTTYDYVKLFTQVVLTTIWSIVWFFAARKHQHHNWLQKVLDVILRFYLGYIMIGYGIEKIFYLQMPFPSLSNLDTPFGYKSPGGLAWSFIGYSPAYEMLSGWLEFIGGLLLFFRKTRLLANLLLFFVIANIVAINFCYDVPVKLFSSALFAMNLYLLWPYLSKLYDFIVGNKLVEVQKQPPLFVSRKWKRAGLAGKYFFILFALFFQFKQTIDYSNTRRKAKPEFYGIHEVKYYVKNRDTLPLLLSDTTVWKKIIVDWWGNSYVHVKLGTTRSEYYKVSVDTPAQKFHFVDTRDSTHIFDFGFTRNLKDSTIFLSGIDKNKDSIQILLKTFDVNKYLLVNRGFNWINEYPNLR